MKIEEIEELRLYLEKSIPTLFEEIAASWLIVGRWSWKRDQRTLL